MVHAPELLGYEQYTPFPAACQWQSERPPPVAGAFAGLFMALGATLLAWERPALTAGLPRAFVCGPAAFVEDNSTYSLRLRLSPSEGRPALAGRSTSLPWGRRPPFWRKGTPKTGKRRPPRALACGPAPFVAANSTYSLRLRLSLSEGRPAGRPLIEFALGPQAPILAKGHAKTGKRRPPRALAREPAPFVAANSTYSLRLRLSLSEGRPALAGRSSSLPWGHRPHFGGRARQNRQTSPASFFSLPLPFWLGAYCHLQGPPKSVDFGGKNSLVGKSMRRKSSQGLSLEATHSFSGTQKS